MPVMEFVDLAVFGAQVSALSSLAVEVVLGFLHLEPLPALRIVLWKKECEGSESFFYEADWKYVAGSSLACASMRGMLKYVECTACHRTEGHTIFPYFSRKKHDGK